MNREAGRKRAGRQTVSVVRAERAAGVGRAEAGIGRCVELRDGLKVETRLRVSGIQVVDRKEVMRLRTDIGDAQKHVLG